VTAEGTGEHTTTVLESSDPCNGGTGPDEPATNSCTSSGAIRFLQLRKLADLLGTSVPRIRRLESDLVRSGWLKRVEMEEFPQVAVGWSQSVFSDLGLVEITLAGQRRIAGALGLDPRTATRYHGLIGAGRSQAGKRRRLLLALAHTLGANAVFVAFATAASAVRHAGGSDDLVEWRGAAACERNYCKPDGYGCYVRNGVAHGFFLEYDRGTESTRTYLAKFRAYYRYRDSRQADRDYNGFPTLLFVTTQPHAEERIADAANRAWFLRGAEPLAVLITTTSRITSDRQAILGRIWRRPGQIAATAEDECQYWLTDGAPGKLVGAGRIAVPPPRLGWPTSGTPRKPGRGSLANSALERRNCAGDLRLSRTLRTARALAGVS
jgi:Replication-relaxation